MRAWHMAVLGALIASFAHTGRSYAQAAVEVTDDTGARVRLEAPARRVVSLTPHLTELLFEAGAGGAIVGATAFSDYPPAARAIPRIGDGRALDLERIVALEPDLVVAWSSGSPRRQVARLQRMGYPVFIHEPRTLASIPQTLERLGKLAGTSDVAGARADELRRRLAVVGEETRARAPLRVFYQVLDRPLLTVSDDHLIVDALGRCGARSIFADAREWLPRPSLEAVLLADPDAIVVASLPGTETAARAAWRRWPRLRAVAEGRVYTVDPSLLHRATPRALDGVAQLCARLGRSSP